MKQGAVPTGFSTGAAPRGMYAWRTLFSLIGVSHLANRSRICESKPSSSTRSRPVARATASRVISSTVGPSPPVVMITSEGVTNRVHNSTDVIADRGAKVKIHAGFGKSLGNPHGIRVRDFAEQ